MTRTDRIIVTVFAVLILSMIPVAVIMQILTR